LQATPCFTITSTVIAGCRVQVRNDYVFVLDEMAIEYVSFTSPRAGPTRLTSAQVGFRSSPYRRDRKEVAFPKRRQRPTDHRAPQRSLQACQAVPSQSHLRTEKLDDRPGGVRYFPGLRAHPVPRMRAPSGSWRLSLEMFVRGLLSKSTKARQARAECSCGNLEDNGAIMIVQPKIMNRSPNCPANSLKF
jgi:hypothetical protein